MEELIKKFLEIETVNSGYGYGDGDGSGSGDGYGDGSGSGYGYGDGDGYGSGSGDGYGYGYGDGYGSGSGDGYGYGYGSGYGDGYGYGSGYGDGSGSGYGYGYGDGCKSPKTDLMPPIADYRKGFLAADKYIATFKSFNKKPVYYIDNIPCMFSSIVNNIAKVEVINDDMSTKKMYIAKSGNLFAHGDTKEQALQAVHDKFYASMSFEEKKAEFIKLFKKDGVYPAQHFFEWHHHLTGSCESGRVMFVKQHGIDLETGMSTITFLNLTKNEYNGQAIRDILNKIK